MADRSGAPIDPDPRPPAPAGKDRRVPCLACQGHHPTTAEMLCLRTALTASRARVAALEAALRQWQGIATDARDPLAALVRMLDTAAEVERG